MYLRRSASSTVARQQQLRRFRQSYDLVSVVGGDGELNPRQIAESLDAFVIGQPEAKREVAVAIRERWRRLQLEEEKAVEITPKNMLVSGPSGCGKTEIIRRVSKLLHAPFVKVDASTFTRRGVVGANVTDMVVDLYDAAEDQCKEFYTAAVKPTSERAAKDLVHHHLVKKLKNTLRRKKKKEEEESDKIHCPTPIVPAPPRNASEIPLNLPGLEKGIGEALKKMGLAAEVGQPVVMYKKDDGKHRNEPENAGRDEDNVAEKRIDWEGILKMKFEDMLLEDDAVLADVLKKVMASGECDGISFDLPELNGVVHVEQTPGTVSEDSVTIAVSKQPAAQPFQQILLSSGMGIFGGDSEGNSTGTDSGTIPEMTRSWEEKILEALTNFKFSAHRSPVKGLVEKWGIICIDEIDKVVGKKGSSGGQDRWMNTDVQQELLTLIEGTKVNLESARSLKSGGGMSILKMGGQPERIVVDTTHILFVCAGAFTLVKPKDMLVELLGRLPVRVNIHSLSEEDLYKILTSTKYPLIQQQTDLFSTENVTLKWDEPAVRKVAQVAWALNNETENTGARVLNTVLRAVLSDYSYRASDMAGETLTITREHVVETTKKLFPSERLETYVL